ncbi:MAG: toll/interleukin-1 receptor domain-containing protein [Betaproteobacteria bacterium]
MKAFISHAREDKDAIARPLADALRARRVDVWFDEYSLRPGDSLRESIDAGLATCDYGIVILSPAFFAKRWPTSELNGLFNRDLASGRRFLFPVWHNIEASEVLAASPMLADRVAISSTRGAGDIAAVFLAVAITDNRHLREGGKIVTSFDPAHRYYDPPDDVPRLGYRLRPGTYGDLIAQLRPRELLLAFGNPRGTYECAGHVTSEERMLEFERSWWIAPEYYAVEFHKLLPGFGVSLSKTEVQKLLGQALNGDA